MRRDKKVFFCELAYLLGLMALAAGTALMERADFGLSMVVAPAYLLHLKLSQYLPGFSFGMAEYCFQALVLVLMGLVLGKFKLTYLFSFCTAVIYGLLLDAAMAGAALWPWTGGGGRIILYLAGLGFCALGVALLFHTYIAPEAYELFVKELAAKSNRDVNKIKTAYDCASCLLAVILSFSFFGLGHFEGVKLGTIVCALINGALIGLCSKGLEAVFSFRDALRLRKYF